MDPQIREEDRCSLAAQALQSGGTLRLRAMGASMLPTLWPGDLVTIQSRNFEQVEAGEVVLYMREGRFYLHRIAKKVSSGGKPFLILRGDAMPKDDPPAPASDLRGIVTEIRREGHVIVPSRQLSSFRLILGRLLGYSDLCQRIALRLHAYRNTSASALDPRAELTAS